MKFSVPSAALLVTGLLLLSGCEQAEKSAQQMLNQAAESAKEAIDDTHKAAGQALSEATQGVIKLEPKPSEPEEKQEKQDSTQEI
jgi:vacuolar-type H+-ATPase subunit H